MILRFGVKRFKSITNLQLLDFRDPINTKKGTRLVAIFGENSSGKTTLLEAINSLRRHDYDIPTNSMVEYHFSDQGEDLYFERTEKEAPPKSYPFTRIVESKLMDSDDNEIYMDFEGRIDSILPIRFLRHFVDSQKIQQEFRVKPEVLETINSAISDLNLPFPKGKLTDRFNASDWVNLSDGMREFLNIAGILCNRDEKGATLLIDDLGKHLHPNLVEELLRRSLEQTNHQIIFTTNQTRLLDADFMKPEFIWFAERRLDGSSSFFPLTDFEPDQIKYLEGQREKGYLQGYLQG